MSSILSANLAHLLRSSAIAALVLAANAASARAAEAASADAGAPAETASDIGEIVVVARKVAEPAQSLPITVAAFTGEQLNKKVVLNIRELATVTPGLTISVNPQGGAPIFAMRGAATENLIDGGVALYLNDVPVISSLGLVHQFYDVATLEVLKGPQGTQFGANTTGGTITVRTNEPTKTREGYLKAEYGSYNRTDLQGTINLPINDAVRFRLAGEWIRSDGYIHNPLGAGLIPKTFGGENHYSLRGSLLVDSGPVRNLIVIDDYHRDDTPIQPVPVAFKPNASFVDLTKLGERTGDRTTVFIAPDRSGRDRGLYERAKIWGVEDRLELTLSDTLSIRNVAGLRSDDTDSSEDGSGTTTNQVNGLTRTFAKQWTDDLTLRFHSADNRLRLSAGGYWSSRKREQGIIINSVQGTFLTYGYPAFGIPPSPITVNNRYFSVRHIDSKALYANGEFDITPSLTVLGGFRYNWDSADVRYTPSAGLGLPDNGYDFLPSASAPCSATGLVAYTDKDLTACYGFHAADWQAPSWTVGLTQHFTPRVLAYAKASHGYLAGGINTAIRERPVFDPETKTEYELGLKADWSVAGRPLRTNLAVYYNKTRNKQIVQNVTYDDRSGANGVFNAARETVYGLDLESRFSPVDGLTLEANYSYVHAKFDSFLFPALGGNADGLTGVTLSPAVDLSGAAPAQTPTHQLNLAATWRLPLAPTAGELSATVSGYYTSKIAAGNVITPFNAAKGLQYNTIDGYSLVNASLNWADILGSPISGQVYVRNLLDRNYAVFRNSQFQIYGYATAIYGQPRTFGVSASVKF